MPAFLAKKSTYDGAKPLLEFFATKDGLLTELYSLECEIWQLVSEPAVQIGSRLVINVGTTYPTVLAGRLSKGRYFATWTVPETEEIGRHELRWFYKFTSTDIERTAVVPFEVLEASPIDRGYCTVSDVRDEGVTEANATNLRVLQGIKTAMASIERLTSRWFHPLYRTFTLDGSGNPLLLLPSPVVGIESVTCAYDGNFTNGVPVDPSMFRVYGRAVSEALVFPDDRQNPRLEMNVYPYFGDQVVGGASQFVPFAGDGVWWPVGSRNLQVAGAFGFTDFDGSPMGETPELIRRACMLLTLKALPKLARASSGGATAGSGALVKRMRTRDQEIEYQDMAVVVAGGITGDAEVDGYLESFSRPPAMFGV